MQIVIKEYNKLSLDELYEILKVRGEVFVEEQKCVYNDLDDKDKKCFHLMLIDEDKLVGYLRILPQGLSFATYSIGRVLVLPSSRKKGFARIILNEAIKFIRENSDEKTITIAAQLYLKKFYQSLGFVQTSEEFLEVGIPHIDMQLTF